MHQYGNGQDYIMWQADQGDEYSIETSSIDTGTEMNS